MIILPTFLREYVKLLDLISCRGPYAFSATDFKGYNCGMALCPKGDYPYTTGGKLVMATN